MSIYLLTEPDMGGDDLLKLAEIARGMGYSMSFIDSEIQNKLDIKEKVLKNGVSSTLRWDDLSEAVLPDNTSRSLLLDTIRYMLKQLNASQSLTIVDPYFFPDKTDADLANDIVFLIEPFLTAGCQVTIVTLQKHNTSFRQLVDTQLQALSTTPIIYKYTPDFHDRFWIADDKRGIFIGTSLNGVGKRYALVDYLQDEDAVDIAARVAQVP